MRLPGTINLPNKKKRDAGRVACPTSLLWANGEAYSLDDFPMVEEAPKAEIPEGELPKVDVDALPISDELKKLIKGGGYERWQGDRSRAAHYVCCEMIRCGIANEVILAILLDVGLRISDHVYDQTDPRRTARRALEAALKDQPRDGVSLKDFVAYLPEHKFIFMPTGALWPSTGVNARLPWINTGKVDDEGNVILIRPSTWLDEHCRVE